MSNLANKSFDSLRLIPDYITLHIDEIVHVQDNSGISADNNRALASFIYSMYLITKARYITHIKEAREAAQRLIINAAKSLIDNVKTIIIHLTSEISILIEALKKNFLENNQWILDLLNFFQAKQKVKESKEDFFYFLDRTLIKIDRNKLLQRHTSIYREIAADNIEELRIYKKAKLANDYKTPGKKLFVFWMTICVLLIAAFGVGLILVGISLFFRSRYHQKYRKQIEREHLTEWEKQIDRIIYG
ncbi:hypothetical protein H6F32_17255 [Anabaena sp. FACHB-1237]|uniref:hypothetical protein n=1 Tax=Anabaena sp. FACHB-1237 TaxID=2692769 RepID=UPI0016810B26|nr:hypothetical protein [Anabaena sp. FACHB-1237]MBD2139275.1 hypothetical protein [Anabaena sp. FACHB-1237]